MERSIRQLRYERGWTQQELAERAGVTKMAVSLWESGQRVPGALQLRAVARALGVSMDDIELPGAEKREEADA